MYYSSSDDQNIRKHHLTNLPPLQSFISGSDGEEEDDDAENHQEQIHNVHKLAKKLLPFLFYNLHFEILFDENVIELANENENPKHILIDIDAAHPLNYLKTKKSY